MEKIKCVCHGWKRIRSEDSINENCNTRRQPFPSHHQEIFDAVQNYKKKEHSENFDSTYGWPLGNWDEVSNGEDMSNLFALCHEFNEDMSLWDSSNVTIMANCSKTNQSKTGTRQINVVDMSRMFWRAHHVSATAASSSSVAICLVPLPRPSSAQELLLLASKRSLLHDQDTRKQHGLLPIERTIHTNHAKEKAPKPFFAKLFSQ